MTPTTGKRGSGNGRRVPRAGDAVRHGEEANLHAPFACGVPGCGHRFSEARLLGLHLRMGHGTFDRERMEAARDGTAAACTLDGVSITASIDVGGHVRLVADYRASATTGFYSAEGCRLALRLASIGLVREVI